MNLGDRFGRPHLFSGSAEYTHTAADRGAHGTSVRGDDLPCTKENLRPCDPHEIEFVVKDSLTYTVGQAVRSPSCVVGNFRFRLLIFPSGTQNSAGNQVSAFVEADPWEHLDSRWMFHGVKYQVAAINWLDYRRSVTKVDTWTFSKDGIDRGWHDMVRTADLSTEMGWLGPENSLCFRASCYLRQADCINMGNDYNMRKETGYIGLKNHGATCYMNGLLQSLFHVGEFRRIVYAIDCDEEEGSSSGGGKGPRETEDAAARKRCHDDDEGGDGGTPSLIQALQNVFYKLQTSDQAVTCRELMKSFGWDTMDAFTQHDAQELNRILCDRLEEKMKGTSMDGSIKKLFEGEMENYIECCDIDYKSQRNETFYDIQLNIKGERGQELTNIEESMRDFTAEETLEGDNAYEAEGHGKQKAKKGIRFKRFPPVLNLQLKRFHFDLEKMDMVKLNTKFDFPTTLDLRGFAPGAGQYLLHAVVVHSGDVNSGHYYVHIKPTLDGSWVKFDDDTVTPCSEFAAVEDNFGGNDMVVFNYFDRTPRETVNLQTPTRARIHNAYMLVYIRDDCAQEILTPPNPMTVNSKMVERCDQEVHLAEQRRREKLEASLKIKIRLVFERDLVKMTGFWDHAEITSQESTRVNRDQIVKELAADVEQMIQVPRSHLAFFVLHYRNNPRQVRFAIMPPNSLFKSHIPQFNAPHFDTTNPHLTVLCIASRGYDIDALKWAPANPAMKPDDLGSLTDDDSVMLLIVKYFCPQTHKIVTLGSYYIGSTARLELMIKDGWVMDRLSRYLDRKEVVPPPEDGTFTWECWEEFSEMDIQHRNVQHTVRHEQLWPGDVIIWHPVMSKDRTGPDVGVEASSPLKGGCGNVQDFPINNVMDYAAHVANSIDVVVALHDHRQPLTIDGTVSNGVWGAARPATAVAPAKKDGALPGGAAKEERPEDAALLQSPAQFKMPVEKELKMDLRWTIPHVTSTIARAFDLQPSTSGAADGQLWLFNGAPSSSPEEALNYHSGRTEQMTLKEVQRNVMYTSLPQKKLPLNFHVVELPFQPGHALLERNVVALCVRFFDDATREVGNVTILVSNNGTAHDIIVEAEKHIQPEWGISGPLRLLEVIDCRVHEVYKPDNLVRSFVCSARSNIFYHCLRIESDPENAYAVGLHDGQKLVEIFHCDRQSQQSFGQPFLLLVSIGEKSLSVKNRIKAKLKVPDAEFKSWRLVRVNRVSTRTHLKDDEAWDSDLSGDAKLCVEHTRPNPGTSLVRQSRCSKPLTIK